MGPVLRRLDGTITDTDLRQLADGRWQVTAWYTTRKVAVIWTRDEGRAHRLYRDAETVRYGVWDDGIS